MFTGERNEGTSSVYWGEGTGIRAVFTGEKERGHRQGLLGQGAMAKAVQLGLVS